MRFFKVVLKVLFYAVPLGIWLLLLLLGVIDSIQPSMPLPSGARLITHEAHGASHGDWYYEKYIVDLTPEEVVAFYERSGAQCGESQESDFSLNAPYQTCSGTAPPNGGFYIQIKRQRDATTTRYTDPQRRKSLALPMQPDASDPIGETYIFVTVRWSRSFD